VTNDPPTTRVTSTVIIPVALETRLATLSRVADPPVSTATRRTTTTTRATTSGGTTTTTTTPIPGATPAATPADEVILDEGSSGGGGGLIARYGIMPWAIGGVALVGLGLWFMMGSGAGASVRANKRRRVRRNSKHKIRRSSYQDSWNVEFTPMHGPRRQTRLFRSQEEAEAFASSVRAKPGMEDAGVGVYPPRRTSSKRTGVPWNYPCPGCGATELGKFGHGAGCKLAHHRLAGTFSVPKRKKSVRRNTTKKKYATHRLYGKYVLQGGARHPCPACGSDIVTGTHSQGCPLGSRRSKRVRRNYSYEHTSHPYKYDTGRVRRNSARSLSEIAAEIRRDWKNPYFGAVPYLQAMGTLDSVRDSYGADRGDSIVAYFLGNATAWRGPTAKRIKAELNAALKERRR
jgi:predicted RNA-binding Zn-ribbon protein involved in translation (DUF1610 family)